MAICFKFMDNYVLTFLDQFSFGVFLFSQQETHKELLCNLKNLVIALVKVISSYVKAVLLYGSI